MKRYSQIIIFLSFASSCVTPFDISTNYQEAIVVQGMITDQPGPYLIQVSKTISVDEQGEDAGVLTGASVTIKDDQGNFEQLTETSPGNFYTSTIQGVVGNSYTITVTTSDGNSYQSSPEKIVPVGDITNLSYQFVKNEDGMSNNQITSTNGFNIFLNAIVLPEQEGRVWWRWTGTYHIFTYPSLKIATLPGPPGAQKTTPDAPKCSGYDVVKGSLVYKGECTCCDCWVEEYNQTALISDPKFITNGTISNYNVAFVQANRRTMYDKYILQVEQFSLSQDVYAFWQAVNIQRSNSSNLFQTPPPKTGSNFTATTPNVLPIIGFFAACSVKTQSLELTQNDVPYPIMPIDTVKDNCLTVYQNSTSKKPSFW